MLEHVVRPRLPVVLAAVVLADCTGTPSPTPSASPPGSSPASGSSAIPTTSTPRRTAESEVDSQDEPAAEAARRGTARSRRRRTSSYLDRANWRPGMIEPGDVAVRPRGGQWTDPTDIQHVSATGD